MNTIESDFTSKPDSFFCYIHDVTPSVVPSAVRMLTSTCTISFHVSFFIRYLLINRPWCLKEAGRYHRRSRCRRSGYQ